MNRLAAAALLATSIMLSSLPALADAFLDGVAAYDKGDYQAAHDLWQPLADQGNPSAQRNLGHLYRRGLGVERDAAQARDLYENAARQGLAGAQANLGRMYLRGDGIEQDYDKAFHWLTQASRLGHVSARYRLATMHDYGLGRPANPEAALLWYALAGKAGHKASLDRMVTLVALLPAPELKPLAGRNLEKEQSPDAEIEQPAGQSPISGKRR
ncbi:MAG: tetratricopeptide repeat protein [Alphaproteobacteria bacterium]